MVHMIPSRIFFSLISYLIASALTWPLWEIIVTFDDEVNLLWSQGLNSATCIFYMNRYGVPAMLILLQYSMHFAFMLHCQNI